MYRSRSLSCGVLTAGLLAAAACSTGAPSAATSSVGDVTPVAAEPSSDATQGAPPGAEILGSPAQGEAFDVTVIASNTTDDPSRWRFTVTDVTCGKPLDPAVMAKAADSVGASASAPAPEPGKQFCVMAIDVENIGKKQDSWNTSGNVSLNVGDTRYTQTQTDDEYALDYAQFWNDKTSTVATFGVNPGSKGPTHGVFQIPVGDKPSTAWFTSGTAIDTIDGAEPGYLVTLK
ncbi:DUF4352 domain-containing protein [Streptomyces sp. NPDC012600]|uniref:DUF4352 domain-containing protein n=2 Tax=Streptomycetaceae TaxID=2062 RepID=A0ABU2W4U9_9ACTN|nr:DUF4352 domain-containing protein [Streptomyces griseus]ARF76646.1 hypothetical protein B7C62_33470 [Kitasatospora albolonga]MDT0492885.1 DUF4352 domain-containing protein [Streptomyces griseus]